jgi:signal transduction histidine kinase
MGGVPLCALALALNLINGLRWLAVGHLICVIGLVISLAITRVRKFPINRFAWEPTYLGIWLSSIVMIGTTGSAQSPIFWLMMALLYCTALALQQQFTRAIILGFMWANVLAWWTVSLAHLPLPVERIPIGLLLTNTLIDLLAITICIMTAISIERDLRAANTAHREELAAIERHLIQTAKMAEVGDLIACAAHEISQPVQSITLATSILDRLSRSTQLSADSVRALNSQISDSSLRLGRLLRQLRDFARNDPFQPEALDLREIIRAMEHLIRLSLETRGIEFRIELPEHPLWTMGDSLRLQQILLNLTNNAKDATQVVEQGWVLIRAEAIGPWNRIRILNNGLPIPLELQGRLFRSTITTKDRGKGTGLGLRITEQLARQHQGRIFFSSGPDQTQFVLDLPILAITHELSTGAAQRQRA